MERALFLSRYAAERLRPPPDSVLISIHDRSEPALIPRAGWQEVLHLRFHDSDGSHLGLEQFSVEHARAALDFVRRNLHRYELFINCQLGVSRSAGFALFFAEVLGIPCLKPKMVEPVTVKTHPAYNRRVYSKLWAVLHDDPAGEAFREAVGL